MSLLKKISTILLTSVILFSVLPSSRALSENNSINRVSGINRYDTAINISKTYFEHSDYVTIASGENYPDALVGGTFTSQTKSPMLLTMKNSLPEGFLKEIKRLSPKKIIVLGGEQSISKEVFNQIKTSSNASVERISGKNRFETAIKIDDLRYKEKNINQKIHGDLYAGVNGYNFPDALVAAPFIGLMSDNGILTYLYLNKSNNTADYPYIFLFGGKGSIPDSKYAQAERFSGNNRYETALSVAEGFKKYFKQSPSKIILVNGENYPDALCASSLSGKFKAPILLTQKNQIDEPTLKYLRENHIKDIIVVGGKNSVSQNIIDTINKVNSPSEKNKELDK